MNTILAAVIEAVSELCSQKSKPWIHYGLTSNDVIDTSTFYADERCTTHPRAQDFETGYTLDKEGIKI